jgi:hypothetical protein
VTATQACYLYCLAPAARLRAVSASGIDGRGEVLVETFGDISAVWSPVEVAEFCGAEAEARLADVAWLGPRAVRHQKVIEESMLQSPVLPARFATLFHSLDNLGALIDERWETISGFFTTLAESREWSVKGCLDRVRARDRLARKRNPAATRVSPGARYLEERRMLGEADRMLGPWLAELCQRAASGLRERAQAFRERSVQVPSPEAGIEVVANWAFLVAPEREAEFTRALEELRSDGNETGFDYSLTGPWPAYSFAPALARNAP